MRQTICEVLLFVNSALLLYWLIRFKQMESENRKLKELFFRVGYSLEDTTANGVLRWTLQNWQFIVGMWGEKTFPLATQESCIAHLQDEVNNELKPDCDPEELADVLLLLLHIAHKRRLNLVEVTWAKFEKNKRRKWGPVNGKGFQSHIEEGDE